MNLQNSVSASTSIGRVQAGEMDTIFTPRIIRGSSKYGVVLLHGAGSIGMWSGLAFWATLNRLVYALGRAGIPAIAPCHDIDHWANDAQMTHITTAISTLATATGCSSTKAALIGVSMGGGASIRYASLNPANVASVNAMIPMASLISIYRNDTPNGATNAVNGNFASLVAPAWGLTSSSRTIGITNGSNSISGTFTATDVGAVLQGTGLPNNAYIVSQTGTHAVLNANATATNASLSATVYIKPTSGMDLNTLATGAAGLPGRLFYSSGDTLVKPADVTALATTAGWTAADASVAGGHTNTTAEAWRVYNGGTEFDDLITNLYANGC